MKANILLIDDDDASLSFMKYLLGSFGHSVVAVADGAQGLQAARDQKPDLIISDAEIPSLDGCELARQLKSDAASKNVPLIAVTASAMPADRERMLSAGFDGYIAKPIVPETFVQEIEAFLPDSLHAGSGADRSAPRAPPPPTSDRKAQFIHELAVAFASNIAPLLENLDQSLARRDFKTLRTAAHKALGSCIFLPEPELIQTLRSLEKAIDKNDLNQIEPLLADVHRLALAVKNATQI